MDNATFDRISRNRMEECLALMTRVKGPEYASSADRLSNFKRAAVLLDSTPEEALAGMWIKHVESLLSIIESLPQTIVSRQRFSEKANDTINYILLLEALLAERFGWEVK